MIPWSEKSQKLYPFKSAFTDQVLAGRQGDSDPAVELALGLVGVMALFLGLMKIAEEGGLLTILARAVRWFLSGKNLDDAPGSGATPMLRRYRCRPE